MSARHSDVGGLRQKRHVAATQDMKKETPTYPIHVNNRRQVQVSSNIRVSYPTIEFLCLSSKSNHVIADIWRHVATCLQMSCRLDTLADTTFSCVCDMTKDMSPTCRRDTRHVFKWRLGKTFQKKTFPAKWRRQCRTTMADVKRMIPTMLWRNDSRWRWRNCDVIFDIREENYFSAGERYRTAVATTTAQQRWRQLFCVVK